jgi:transposase
MKEVIRIGLDTSKSVFQVHGVDAAERPVLVKKLRRSDVERFFASLPPTLIGWRRAEGRIIGRGFCSDLGMRCACCRRNT